MIPSLPPLGQNESAAMEKTNEIMQEEAKQFGKEPGEHPSFSFMQ